jgi:DNA replication protein DnaC
MINFEEEIVSFANKLKLEVFSKYTEYYDPKKPFNENLHNLLYFQNILTNQKSIERKIKLSGFPYIKTMDEFEYEEDNFPNLNYNKVINLTDCNFVAQKNDIIMVGQPGKGKTHLAIALGYEAIKHNYSVKFYTASNLMTKIAESKTEKSLDRMLLYLGRYDVLIIDEIGYSISYKNMENYLFDVISSRNELKSTILTTNFPLSKWGELGWEKNMTAAFVDRLTHHSIILDMTGGESYRLAHSLTERK